MRRKLLLADDSITVQRVIELTFSDEGLDIVTVGDGTRAIECLQRDRPDIVLADLSMPGADGYEVADHVKHGSDLVSHTRVVLLTGAFEPVDQERARLLGVDGVLAKPFEPQVAIELVRQLLKQPPLSPPRVQRPAAVELSDWTADLSGTRSAGASAAKAAPTAAEVAGGPTGGGEAAAPAPATGPAVPIVGDASSAVSAGYPFEPGAGGARSSPAELDDYFKRLDEALTNAGLMASPAVKDMLAESAGPASAGPTKGIAGASGAEAADARAGTPRSETTETAGEERQMTGMPAQGPVHVTLVDAFSALLAAEQGERSGTAPNFAFWAPAAQPTSADPSTAVPSTGDVSAAAPNAISAAGIGTGTGSYSSSGDDATHATAEAKDTASGPGGGADTAPQALAAAAVAAAPAAASAVTEAQLEAIVRRVVGEVVGEIADRIVREIAGARVLDVAERLVREEIDRLKADAESEAAPADASRADTAPPSVAHLIEH